MFSTEARNEVMMPILCTSIQYHTRGQNNAIRKVIKVRKEEENCP